MLTFRRRRVLHRHACLISVMAAFCFGLVLGILLPLFGYLSSDIDGAIISSSNSLSSVDSELSLLNSRISNESHKKRVNRTHHMPHFPTIDDIRKENSLISLQIEENDPEQVKIYNSVSFIQAEDDSELETNDIDQGSYNRLPSQDVWVKNSKRKYGKYVQEIQEIVKEEYETFEKQPKKTEKSEQNTDGIIVNDIYWGPVIERNLPTGFTKQDTKRWHLYLNHSEVTKLEPGCGRMQNRLIHFRDGQMACARYRQNTDQLQGELFSFYLGNLLNLTNLAPSIATVLDPEARFWSSATEDITDAQWRKGRPIVLTKWLTNLEPAGIPKQFQPLERHLNKFDVKNITMSMRGLKPISKLFEKLGIKHEMNAMEQNKTKMLTKLVELAQWSDLIIFDYLIANLDRVVNNLYNHQWNADIMEAPAHNLAKQVDTNLLVFLDNESGLLHGYRLLKKYETYHGLLLNNLCIYRKPTINALKQLRKDSAIGEKLNKLFEQTTSQSVRDVLPPLPEKSIKILISRVDRVLDQVRKCSETFASAATATTTTTR
ncbi:extracellular serine/threonine protein kinase four-jointed [Culicoides brevitarsis]|uniref:extracellular serine/threonine protein kinase four-jointed n=1 Tax=Culicoides brevitarsis TaxID=469753 RepID=UPI00307B1A8A